MSFRQVRRAFFTRNAPRTRPKKWTAACANSQMYENVICIGLALQSFGRLDVVQTMVRWILFFVRSQILMNFILRTFPELVKLILAIQISVLVYTLWFKQYPARHKWQWCLITEELRPKGCQSISFGCSAWFFLYAATWVHSKLETAGRSMECCHFCH